MQRCSEDGQPPFAAVAVSKRAWKRAYKLVQGAQHGWDWTLNAGDGLLQHLTA